MRTFIAFATLSLIATLALAAPHNKPNANKESNSFSGAGGNATGGSVESSRPSNERFQGTGLMSLIGGSLLQMNANNAGDGGRANSGVSGAGPGSSGAASRVEGAGVKNAYTGVGGDSTGGSVHNAPPALLQVGSGNAGSGGGSQSGDSKSG
ncbi:hypothetical protein PC9H_003896 [Pleurotus ostreatus]|uniref:Uncharacterized protein n=3 Tax=Pleurotus TaxID=5320 RepID=A0A067P3U6_PLEO1|nr:uncharacterized protein PC9H_003896 [Pleurotus ostreatus]KAF7437062.1 hypothetical protein PC9H_003896 [Pleurotus ostreatus]KAG9223035.1 hypothetical protein CCMSSC00406_0000276 [Pleurotus cornucopiae]KAJ8702907.1 hypothetical protein PTI98_001580 [Pleurotus ostreatus]KDQ30556.1 hypothetical protein PLEOSDRAFT_1111375 [Pleurotus ostreatus PC15]